MKNHTAVEAAAAAAVVAAVKAVTILEDMILVDLMNMVTTKISHRHKNKITPLNFYTWFTLNQKSLMHKHTQS